jgi:hypothetical protein
VLVKSRLLSAGRALPAAFGQKRTGLALKPDLLALRKNLELISSG